MDPRSVLLKRNFKERRSDSAKPKVNSQVGRTRVLGILDSSGQRLRESLSFLVKRNVSPSMDLEEVKSNKEVRFLVLPNLTGSRGYLLPSRGREENNELEQVEVYVQHLQSGTRWLAC